MAGCGTILLSLLIGIRVRVLFLFVILEDVFVLCGAVIVDEQVRVVLEESFTGHERHLGAIFPALGLFSDHFSFNLCLLTSGSVNFPLVECLECDRSQISVVQVGSLFFNLLFEGLLVLVIRGFFAILLLVTVEHVTFRQPMEIGTIVSCIGASPVETIEFLLDSLEEIATGNDSVWRLASLDSRVSVQVDSHVTGILEGQIVTILALLAFLTNTGLEIGTQCLLLVDFTVFIDCQLYDTLEERSEEGFLGSRLLLLFLLLMFSFFLTRNSTLSIMATVHNLVRHLLDITLHFLRLVSVFKTESLVIDDLLLLLLESLVRGH